MPQKSTWLDRAVMAISPRAGYDRLRYRNAARVIQNYDAAGTGRRSRSWNPTATDADAAAARRLRLAFVSRDMIRNTPYAVRARSCITNNVVGTGIKPSFEGSEATVGTAKELLRAHLSSTDIDATAATNFYGLQKLVMSTVVESGEVLVRRRRRNRARFSRLRLPFQLQVMEADYLYDGLHGRARNGNYIYEGIEYDLFGQVVAYHLYREHPGNDKTFPTRINDKDVERVPASEIAHIYRQDRPGQRRGVSWLAPVALALQDLNDHQDAQLMRQKIAACFAAFRVNMEDTDQDVDASVEEELQPGAVQSLAQGEDIKFATPPGVDGFDEFTKVVLRSIAAGLGITYEALTGDLSNVNFSSARMGRIEMDRNINEWQSTMLLPQFLQRFETWLLEAWALSGVENFDPNLVINWTMPRRVIVDPNKEFTAFKEACRAGFTSRSAVIRSLGDDPDQVMREIQKDNEDADAIEAVFDSDGRSSGKQENGGQNANPSE